MNKSQQLAILSEAAIERRFHETRANISEVVRVIEKNFLPVFDSLENLSESLSEYIYIYIELLIKAEIKSVRMRVRVYDRTAKLIEKASTRIKIRTQTKLREGNVRGDYLFTD